MFHKTLVAAAALTAMALPAAAAPATAGARAAGPSLHELLEQEKLVTNVYKAYFPSLELARKAAITFHNNLLEGDYASGYLVFQLDAAEMDTLRRFGFRLAPATDYIERRNRALTQAQIAQAQRVPGEEPQSIPGYSCYETVEETFAAGDALIAAHPTLASWVSAGSSWLKTQGSGGYDMKVLKITNSAVGTPDGSTKPRLFVNSAIHAREYTTAPLALEFARWLINGYGTNADATWIVDHHEVHLMLQTNPDGRKKAESGLSWRKNVNNNYCANTNTRGIDLNRNFTATWNTTAGQGSSGSQCDLTYRGPSAGSEPETKAVESYIRSLWPDRRGPGINDAAPADTSGIHIDLHSYSQLVLWPWGETTAVAPNGVAMQTLGRRLAYFNGYTPQQSIGLYPTDGTSDAPSYYELGVPSLTIEMGTAFFESCTSYNTNTKPKNLLALIYAAKVVRTPYLTPAGPDVTTLTLAGTASDTGVAAGTAVALAASATDTRFNNSNGTEATQAIAAAEYSIDTPPWQAGVTTRALAAADGSFNSSTEALSGSIDTSGLALGQHIVYVRARDASGSWGPVTAVFLNISSVPTLQVLDTEPNGTLETAQAIASLPAQVTGTFDPMTRLATGDVDVFRLTLAAGQPLNATLTPNIGTSVKLEIVDAKGTVLVSHAPGSGQVALASTLNSSGSAQTYYVRISFPVGPRSVDGGLYTLQLTP